MQNNCTEECECKCTGKKVIIDFCNTKVYEDKVSYEIKEEIFQKMYLKYEKRGAIWEKMNGRKSLT